MQIRGWMGVGMLMAVGCSAAVSPEDGAETSDGFYADSTPPTKDQAQELAQLGTLDEARFRPVTHDLELLRGPNLAEVMIDPGATAVAFVGAHPAIFSGATIRVDEVLSVSDGTVVHASQLAGNRRVLEAGLSFAFDTRGVLVEVGGAERFVGPLPDPQLSPSAAEVVATSYLKQVVPGSSPLVTGITEQVISGGRGAFRVELEASSATGPTRRAIVVDDQNSTVLGDLEELQFLSGSGVGVAGETRALNVTSMGDGIYALVDGTRGGGISTYGWAGAELPGSLESSRTPDAWDTVEKNHGAAVDAHANAALAFDYFHDVLGRAGLDGHSAPLLVSAHFGQGFNGAFWDGAQLVFGDGDGQRFSPLGSGLDIVTHEFAHGVIRFASGLGSGGQSGALNEALADGFASFAQLHAGDPTLAWKIGATVFTAAKSGDAIRDLSDPHRLGQPDNVTQLSAVPADAAHDDGNIHLASTVAGNAIFLMSVGGTNRTSGRSTPGIGIDHAQHVLFHALTHGLSSSADFTQGARATIASALRLYGTPDAAAVQAAWEAVGVLIPTDDVVPAHDAGLGDIEPNDSRKNASALALGDEIHGEISTATDKDYYRFDIAASRDVTLTLTGLVTDLDLRVYDAWGRIVARSEQPGLTDEVIHARASPGPYFVKVYGPAGTSPVNAGYRLELQ